MTQSILHKDWALLSSGSVAGLLQGGHHKAVRDVSCNEVSASSMSLVFHLVLI